jgi:predicted HAD superfamily phosphohydrolase
MILLAKLAIGMGATALLGASYMIQDGFVHVSVDEYAPDGTHLHLIVPAVLAPLAATCIPERHLHEVREQAGPYLPMVREAVRELSKLPDSEFVVVNDGDQHVRVAKAGSGIKVEVHSPEEDVNVWIPLRATYDTVWELQSRFTDEKSGAAEKY